jgi:hypothetical protein
MSKQCHEAGFWDYVAVIGSSIGQVVIEELVKQEKKKPESQRDDFGIFLGELCKLGLDVAKYKVNENLCNPVG